MTEKETAMPCIFDGLWIPKYVANKEVRNAFLQELKTRCNSTFEISDERLVFEAKSHADTWLWIPSREGDDLAYVMHLFKVKLMQEGKSLLQRSIYQGSVWTNDELGVLKAGAAKEIFWKLLKRNGIIISDTQQSIKGKNFWVYMLKDALAKGKAVFALHIGKDNEVLEEVRISRLADADKAPYWTYERHGDERGLEWRFAIFD